MADLGFKNGDISPLDACNCHFDPDAYYCADCIEICGFTVVDPHAPLETVCKRCETPTDCYECNSA